jgi:hypothetical protein
MTQKIQHDSLLKSTFAKFDEALEILRSHTTEQTLRNFRTAFLALDTNIALTLKNHLYSEIETLLDTPLYDERYMYGRELKSSDFPPKKSTVDNSSVLKTNFFGEPAREKH